MTNVSIFDVMDDMAHGKPDLACLYAVAAGQHGYFTTTQARKCGIRWNLLGHYLLSGRFIRAHRAVYRLRDFPSSPREEVMAAWLAIGRDKAVVSHESALDLLDLGDVVPDAIHLTVPRSMRYRRELPGVAIHTTTRPLGSPDLVVRDGIRLTSAVRAVLDAAEAGTDPAQIQRAVVESIERGLTTRAELEREADGRSERVSRLIHDAVLLTA